MKHADQLRKLAEGLPRVPQEKFRMNVWGYGSLDVSSPTFDCPYAGCAIGWMPRIVPEAGLTVERRPGGPREILHPRYNDFWFDEAIKQCLGLTWGQIDHLFRRYAYPWGIAVTPTMVAERILLFLDQNPPVADQERTDG